MEQTEHQLIAEEQVARVARLSHCGLSVDEIVFVLKARRAFVKDALALPDQKAEPFSESPYARSFSAYVRVRYGAGGRTLAPDEEARLRLVEILEKKIKVDALQSFLKRTEVLARRVCNPVIPEAFATWHALLSDIFTDKTYEREEVSWTSVWYDYVGDLRSRHAAYPESYRGAEKELGRRYGDVITLHLRSRWTPDMGMLACERLTEALRLLSEHNNGWWQVVCRRHGLGQFKTPSTLSSIATEEGWRHTERVRQKYISGLNFLAPLLRRIAPCLDRFVSPEKGELAALYVRASEENRTLREKLAVATFGEKAALVKPVTEIGFSTRTMNAMNRARIEFVWVLTMKHESELLKTRDFSRKSLDEVKRVLAGLGLSLGMEFDAQTVAQLEEQTGQ